MNVNKSFWRYDNNILLRGLLWLNYAYHWEYGTVLVNHKPATRTFLGTDLVVGGAGYLTAVWLTMYMDPTYEYNRPIGFDREFKEWWDFLKYSAKP